MLSDLAATLLLALRLRKILSRRSDLSTFVVHLTRDWEEPGEYLMPAAICLEEIIRERLLRAVTPMGWARDQDDPNDAESQTQRVVAFSETPLEHTWAMFEEIEDRERAIELQPYGLAMTKVIARRLGVNPVWYVDMTPSGHPWLSTPISRAHAAGHRVRRLSRIANRASPPILRLDGRAVPREPDQQGVLVGA